MTAATDNRNQQSHSDLAPIGAALDRGPSEFVAPSPLYRQLPAGYSLPAIKSPGAYLRHRASTARAQRIARRRVLLRRALLMSLFALLYLAIGRDLVAMARAGYSAKLTQLRGSARTSPNAPSPTFAASLDKSESR